MHVSGSHDTYDSQNAYYIFHKYTALRLYVCVYVGPRSTDVNTLFTNVTSVGLLASMRTTMPCELEYKQKVC